MRPDNTMTLIRGTRLGPYEIETPLGAGGMGEVYRARDTRLDRAVAIKVMRSLETPSPAMRERFQREARAIAQLSHPNICTLYDVGHLEGTDFLVMEYLEGETLDTRISRQKLRSLRGDVPSRMAARAALPLDETLRIATQLAEALAAAQRAGIVHRDLKPGNIMLTRGGVKVLDFGLARFQPWTAVSEVDCASTVTATSLTGEGALVGTMPFMAPEQLEGRSIDARADIFALGTIVYEMATGRRAFTADSQAGLIAAILEREPPPITDDEPHTPRSLERLVRKCLAKNPDDRWQSASDIADQLRWIAPGEDTAAGSIAKARPGGRRGWTTAAVVLLAGAACVALWQRAAAGQPTAARFTKVTFAGDVRAADLSPDGKTVAYASGVDSEVRVFVRDLTGDRSLEIWKGTNLWALRWLPNGSQLLLGLTNGDMWRLSRLGGPPQQVVRGPSAYIAFGPHEAEFVHSMEDMAGYQITAIDSTGSRTVYLNGFHWLIGLDWNRVTNRVLALSLEDSGAYAVWSTTPEGKDVRRQYSDTLPLHAICSSPATGAIYLLRERNDATEILRLTPSSSNELRGVVLTSVVDRVAARSCRVSDRGDRMLYSRQVGYSNIWRFDLRMPTQPAVPLTRGTSLLQSPRVSPDGQWILASQGTGSNSHIVRFPANGGEPVQITSGTIGVQSPKDRQLAFVSGRTNQYRVWTSDPDGLAAAEVPDAVTANPTTIAWLPDGRLAWQTADAENYRIRDLANGHEELLMRPNSGGYASYPHFSPNNEQVAFFWITRRSGLYVLSWPSREPRFLAPNLAPIGWSQDGEWIYALQAVQPFKAQNSTSALVRVSPRTSRVELISSFPRGYLKRGSCSLTPDRQAIICALAEETSDAWIIDDFDPDMHSEKR
jgi:tRNA A-37 threonylcarbamoyl transferase component Bud32/WD40 repeat protein